MKEFDYIIIGGGCAGLSLAYELEINEKLKEKTLAIIEPRIESLDPTIMHIRTANNASFTLEILNGTADIRLVNYKNLLNGEQITVSNPDGEDMTITQTAGNGSGNILVNGTAIPGGLPASVTKNFRTRMESPGL